nr:hypothetical protein [Tanacetum cinerariifolium]
MLVESDYNSWKIRIHRYIRGKPHGKLIWKSIQDGPSSHPMITDPQPEGSTVVPMPRKKLDSEFSDEENTREMADTQAEIILSQGLPRHIFNILNQTSTAKEIEDNMNMKFVNNLPSYWAKYVTNVKQNMDISSKSYVDIYTHLKAYEPHAKKTLLKLEKSSSLADPLAYAPGNVRNNGARGKKVIYFNCRGEGHVSRQCKEPKRKMDSRYFKDKMLLMEAKEKGATLDAEAEAFLTDVQYSYCNQQSSQIGGNGPTLLFDIDTLTQSMNYQPIVAKNQPNSSAGIQETLNAGTVGKEATSEPESVVHVSPSSYDKTKKHDEKTKREAKGKSPVKLSIGIRDLSDDFEEFSNNNTNRVNAASTPVTTVGPNSTNNTNTFSAAGASNTAVSPTFGLDGKSSFMDPSQYPDDPDMPALEDITYSVDEEDVGAEADFSYLETNITVNLIPTSRVHKDHPVTQIIGDLSSAPQTRSMTRMVKEKGGLTQINNEDFHTCMFACFLSQEEPKRVWVLVDLPKGKRAIGSKWVFRNKKDERGIVNRNKARLVAQDLDYPGKVYKVVKALYGLHQAPRAWYETLANYLLENGFQRGKIDQTLFIKKQKDGKSASTLIDTEKPLLKDPDINRIFRYLMGKPHLGLWYPKDSPFNLVAYSDSDYARASLDRKSTTRGCQFLGCRLISSQCKKQTIIAILSTEAEYVADVLKYYGFKISCWIMVDEKDGIEISAIDLKMTSLANKAILSGADNRPPMLKKDMYDSWKSIMELYMLNRQHGRMILESVENGPLIWPTVEENRMTRSNKYSELSTTEVIQADCDVKATNIILQGLPPEVYALRECKLYDEFDKFAYKKGESLRDFYLRFSLLLNDMNIYNMKLEQFQVNTKFLNTLLPEWSKFMMDVKLVRDLHTTNIDQLHAYLGQHEYHENEVLHERTSDPLALVANHQMNKSLYQPFQQSYQQNQFQPQVSSFQTSQYGSPYHSSQYASQVQSSTPLSITYPSNDFQSSVNHNVCNPSSSIPQVEYAPAGEGHMSKKCTKPKRKRDEAWFKDKVLLVQAQANGQVLHGRSRDSRDSKLIIALMGNLSHYGSDNLAEVHNQDNMTNNVIDQDVQAISTSEQSNILNQSETKITSDSNIIWYSQYMNESQYTTVQNSSFLTQQDDLILSVIEQLKTQVVNCTKINQDNKNVNEILTVKLERYKDQVRILKERNNVDKASESCAQSLEIDNLKHTLFKHLKEKEPLEQMVTHLKNDFQKEESRNIDRELALEKQAQQLEPKLYNGSVIHKTDAIMIRDSEETLMLKDDSRSKMLQKQKDPLMFEKKTKLSAEQAFWSQNLVNSEEPNLSTSTTIVEVPKELPKVSMVNSSLKKVKFHLASFDVVVKERTTATAITEGTWGFEHKKACFRDEIIPFVKALKDLFNSFDQFFIDELTEVQNVFNQMEQAVEQHCVKKNKFQDKMKDVLKENERLLEQAIRADILNIVVNANVNYASQSQEKDTVIMKLKERIKSLSGNVKKEKIKGELQEIETINIELDHRVTKLVAENEHLKQTYKQLYDSIKSSCVRSKEQSLKDTLRKLKGKAVVNEAVTLHPIDPELLKIDVAPLAPKLRNNRTAHNYYLKHTQEETATLREIVENEIFLNPLNTSLDYACKYTKRVNLLTSASKSQPQGNTKKDKIQQTQSRAKKNKLEDHPRTVRPSLHNKKSVVNTKAILSVPNSKLNVNFDLKCATSNGCLFSDNHDSCVLEFINSVNARVKSRSAKRPVVQIVLWYLDSGCSKHMTEDHSQLINFVQKFLGMVKFKNDHVAKIMGYGDNKIGNVSILRVYFVEGLGHNLFSVGQFCDSDLEVAFRQHTCFICNLDGVDLLTGSRGNNLYTLSLKDMMASSPICLFSKASKTKSWLWHRHLSHLNFESVNGKKYILVIVNDYSRFTWVKCLRSKDEAPDFIIKFLKMIQVRLKMPIRRIRTDNGTEFVNQMLREYYEQVGISHETSVTRSLQQIGVIERRNHTQIEATRTMLIYA